MALRKGMLQANLDRADAAESGLEAMLADQGSDGAGNAEDNMTDLLTNLRHLCDKQGISFGDCDRIAHQHYLAELEGE